MTKKRKQKKQVAGIPEKKGKTKFSNKNPESVDQAGNKSKPKKNRFWGVPGFGLALAVLLVLLFFTISPLRNIFTDKSSQEQLGIIGQKSKYPVQAAKQKNPDEVVFSDFAGSEACVVCHVEQYSLWRNSTHGLAGGEPGKVKIVAGFDGNPIYFNDAVLIPSVTEGGVYIFTVQQRGASDQVVRVDAVVGGGHMEGGGTQSFFTKFADGTLRFVPFDFNRTDGVWFAQLKNLTWVPISKKISIHNLQNWPSFRILGTYDKFSNCQNCHGSQILVEFDSEEQRYNTRYTTLQINCESCHGPGKKHIKLIEDSDPDSLTDIGIIVLSTVDKDESLNKCFECHAEKAALSNEFLPGKNFEQNYALKFPIIANDPFFPDGRIRAFAYQQNHLFSDCYINGSMTCVDCHDPHSLGYRDIYGTPLIGKFDDGQCTDCHPSKAQNPEQHSHHKPDSPGNVCTACHMPFLQHPMLGDSVRFARSDHVIPIPRPEFDAQLGIQNACQQCHSDRSIAWQQQKTDEWYGKLKPHNLLISNYIEAQDINDIKKAANLLLTPDYQNPVAQIRNIFDFTKRFLTPNMNSLDREIVDNMKRLTDSKDVDLKSLAFVALHLSVGHLEEDSDFLGSKLSAQKEREHIVRIRWAFAMDYIGTLFSIRKDFKNAIIAHKKSLEIIPSDAFTLVNLANAYKNNGDNSKAVETFKQAIRVRPTRANSYFQLAVLYTSLEQKQKAIKALKNGLKYDPDNANAKHMLGRLNR